MIFRVRSLTSDTDIDDFLIQGDDPEPLAQVVFQNVMPFAVPLALPVTDTTSIAAAIPNAISLEATLTAALGQSQRPSLDAGLTALAHGASVTTPLFPVVGGLSVGHAPGSISPDGHYVTIDATARDGDGAALLLQLQAIGLQKGGSFKGMASGLMPIDQVDALLGIANLAHARESGGMSRAGLVTAQADVSMRADIARSTFGFD